MGAIAGSVSYTLYHVPGDIDAAFRDEAFERIARFWFRPLHPDMEEDTSTGWCDLDDILLDEARPATIFRDVYLCLGLRVDKWALPATLLKARVKRAEREYVEQTKRPRLTRGEKDSLREQVTREMRRQSLASASVVDVVWNLDDGKVRFWSQSGRANERFVELFHRTFEIRLIPDTSWVAALQAGLDEHQVGLLGDVEPARFTPDA